MDTPQITPEPTQEEKKRSSPWLIIILILLLFMMGCCILGVILCRGSSRLPDLLDRYLREIPGLDSGDFDFRGLVDILEDPEDFDLDDFYPYDPDDPYVDPNLPDTDLLGPTPTLGVVVSGDGECPSEPTDYSLKVSHNWDFAPNRDTVNMKIDGWTEPNAACPVVIDGPNVTMAPCAVLVSNDGFVQTDEGPCSVTAYGYTEITLDEPRCENGVVVARIIDVIDPDLESSGEMVCPGFTQPYFPFYPFSNTAVQFRLQPGGDTQVDDADPDVSNQYKYHKEWRLVPAQ